MLLNLSAGVAASPRRARLVRERVRQRPVAGDEHVGAEQQVRLARERALDAIGEERRRCRRSPTASTSAAISTVSSPARQSRDSIRSASCSVCMRSASAGIAASSPTSRPAASESAPRAARREPRVVRDEQQRRAALAIQAEHQIGDLDAGRVVEIAGRLVGHQQLRLAGERARDRDALLLAARQLLRIMRASAARGRRDRATRRARAVASAAPASSSGSITFSSAVNAGSSWNDWNTKPSSRWRSAARASSSCAESAMPSSQTSPSLGRSRPASSPEQRRLARARCADDRDGRAGVDVEAHVVEDRQRGVAAGHDLGQVRGAEDRSGHVADG